jgi:hypothetical protein
MHLFACITSRYFFIPRMCGRSFDFFLGTAHRYSNACRITYSSSEFHKFHKDEGPILPLKDNLLSVRNLKLVWHFYLFCKYVHPCFHRENHRTLGGKETSCCESHVINLIKFLISKCGEILQKISPKLTKEEGDRPRITKYIKRFIHRVFRVDQYSFPGQWPRSFTANNSMRGQSIAVLIIHNITLSLRIFAYEFAQHKEVPGDQLKPSKERIKNVNTSNQQRRC